MSGYQHADLGWGKECGAWSEGPDRTDCGCINLLPDPASPCATCGHERRVEFHVEGMPYSHTHVPTLCATCHHAIEAAP